MIHAILPVASGSAIAPRAAKASPEADAVFGALVAKAAGASRKDANAIVSEAISPAKAAEVAIDRPVSLPQAALVPAEGATAPLSPVASFMPAAGAATLPIAGPIATTAALPDVAPPARRSVVTPSSAPTTVAALMATSMLRPAAVHSGVVTIPPAQSALDPAELSAQPDPILPSSITDHDPAADPSAECVALVQAPISRPVIRPVPASTARTSPQALPAERPEPVTPPQQIAAPEPPIAGEPKPAPMKIGAIAGASIVTAAIASPAASSGSIASDKAADEPATPAPPKPRLDVTEPATGLQAVIAAMAASAQPTAVVPMPAPVDSAAKRIAPQGSADRQPAIAALATPAIPPRAASEALAARQPAFVVPAAPARPGEDAVPHTDPRLSSSSPTVAPPVVDGATSVVADVAVLPVDATTIPQPAAAPIEQPASGAAPAAAPPAAQALAGAQQFATGAVAPSKPVLAHGQKRAAPAEDTVVALRAASGAISEAPEPRQLTPAAMPDIATPALTSGPTAAMPAAPLAEAALTHHLDLAKDSAWLDRLAHDIARSADTGGQLRFSLAPEHLGRLDVALAQSADGTAIRLTTETREAHRIVAEAQPRLVAEARAQGMRVTDTSVDLGSSSHPRQDAAQQQGFGNQNGAGGGQSQRSFPRPQPSAPAPVRAAAAETGGDDALYA